MCLLAASWMGTSFSFVLEFARMKVLGQGNAVAPVAWSHERVG